MAEAKRVSIASDSGELSRAVASIASFAQQTPHAMDASDERRITRYEIQTYERRETRNGWRRAGVGVSRSAGKSCLSQTECQLRILTRIQTVRHNGERNVPGASARWISVRIAKLLRNLTIGVPLAPWQAVCGQSPSYEGRATVPF